MNVYVINRLDRPDRFSHTREELSKQGLNARRFEALIETPGYLGCRDSHLSLIELHKNEKTYAIIEDDIQFINDYHPFVQMAVSELPTDFDMLYLGASPKAPQERYSDSLFRLRGAVTAHAIIYHPRPGGAVEYILSHREEIVKIDRFYADVVQPLFKVFCVYPMICTQVYGLQSDTCRRADTSTIYRNYRKFCR